jgi:cytoskeleton protein RodZ
MTDEPIGTAPASTTAGQMLRSAREQRGLHIAVLAAATKVPQTKLEALEADRYDALPDITFARALAQTVCRALKIDPAPVLARLPHGGEGQAQGLVHVAGGLRTPFREHAARDEPDENALYRRPVFWATALVLLGAAVLALAPDNLWQRFESTPAEPPASAAMPPVSMDPAAASEPTSAAPEPLPATPLAATPVLPAAASEPTSSGAVAGSAAVLRANAPSWVQVRDARGRVLMSRTLDAGESVDVDGAPPLKFTIGNAKATELRFRGKPVDLAPTTGRDNVARLELQ